MKKKASHQYNRIERNIARQLHDIKKQQHYYFNKWHDLDVKANLFKQKLNGKFLPGKVMVPHLLTKE